jgi:hypothetical protein
VDSNHVPPRYQHGALPVELAAQFGSGESTILLPEFWSLLGRLAPKRTDTHHESPVRLASGGLLTIGLQSVDRGADCSPDQRAGDV